MSRDPCSAKRSYRVLYATSRTSAERSLCNTSSAQPALPFLLTSKVFKLRHSMGAVYMVHPLDIPRIVRSSVLPVLSMLPPLFSPASVTAEALKLTLQKALESENWLRRGDQNNFMGARWPGEFHLSVYYSSMMRGNYRDIPRMAIRFEILDFTSIYHTSEKISLFFRVR